MSKQNNRNNRGRKRPDETIMNENIRARELRVLSEDGKQFYVFNEVQAQTIFWIVREAPNSLDAPHFFMYVKEKLEQEF